MSFRLFYILLIFAAVKCGEGIWAQEEMCIRDSIYDRPFPFHCAEHEQMYHVPPL